MEPNRTSPGIRLRLRLVNDDGAFAMGPGKALLLESIRDTGSISAAGRHLDMSYRKARVLVDQMNQDFRGPLVAAAKGGHGRGGALLTDLGLEILAHFRTTEALALQAVHPRIETFRAYLVQKA